MGWWGVRCAVFALMLWSSTLPQAHAAGETLYYALDSNPRTLDPAKTDISTANIVIWHLSDSLVIFDERGNLRPALANSWKVSEDGRTWTFYLREGVKFHDGTPFDARAVKANFERQMKPAKSADPRFLPYLYTQFLEFLDHVEVVNDLTVRLILRYPYGPLLSTMASNYGPMVFVSPTAFSKAGDAYGRAPVGTGPFKFESWTEGKEIVLTANPSYWGGQPKLGRVSFKVVPDANERLSQLQDGSLQVITDFDPKFVERTFSDPSIEFTPVSRPRVEYLGFSTTVPPYTDRRVRQAIASAINVDRIVLYLSRGTATPAHGPLPPEIWGYNPQARQPRYDLKRARELLAEAGYPQGFKTRLMAYDFIPGRYEYADAIRSDLKKLGLDVELIPARNWDEVYKVLAEPVPLLFTDGWTADFADPDNILFTLFYSKSEGNYTKYRNPQVDELLLRARQSSNASERLDRYRKIQEILSEEVPSVFLDHPYILAAYSRNVRGLILNSLKRPFDKLMGVDIVR